MKIILSHEAEDRICVEDLTKEHFIVGYVGTTHMMLCRNAVNDSDYRWLYTNTFHYSTHTFPTITDAIIFRVASFHKHKFAAFDNWKDALAWLQNGGE